MSSNVEGQGPASGAVGRVPLGSAVLLRQLLQREERGLVVRDEVVEAETCNKKGAMFESGHF